MQQKSTKRKLAKLLYQKACELIRSRSGALLKKNLEGDSMSKLRYIFVVFSPVLKSDRYLEWLGIGGGYRFKTWSGDQLKVDENVLQCLPLREKDQICICGTESQHQATI